MAVLELLHGLSHERFFDMYSALQENGFGPLDAQVASALRFRPQAIRKLPMETRARRARHVLESSRNTQLAYELLGTYLLKNHKKLVTRFLDATGVVHKEGMLEDVGAGSPAPDKLEQAIQDLDASSDPEVVTMYLAVCAEQWPDHAPVQAAWKDRLARAQAKS